jgi:LAO/AO transport system kinase
VLACSAREGTGIADVWNAIDERYQRLCASGQLEARRRQQNLHWLWAIVNDRLQQLLQSSNQVRAVREAVESEVLTGRLTPALAARQILAALGLENL